MAYRYRRRSSGSGRAWWNSLSAEEKAKRLEYLKGQQNKGQKAERESERSTNQQKEDDYSHHTFSHHHDSVTATKDVRRFGNASAFVDACQQAGISFGSNSWMSDESSELTYQKTLAGEESRVVHAQALIDQFNSMADISAQFACWDLDVAGAFPSVPDYLSGFPENMWTLSNITSNLAPLRIWVCVTSSGGCDAEALEKRGIAIMALVMALSVTRSVSVTLFSGLDGSKRNHVVTVDLSAPFNLSQVAYMLGSQSFARGLTYQYLQRVTGAAGGWPDDVGHGTHGTRMDQWRKLLEIPEGDVIFPHVFYSDPDLVDPVKYCQELFETIVNKANT